MMKVAITGNIGSGKSTACKVFETLGVPVFYADSEAKQLYENHRVQQEVKKAFGDDLFDRSNQLNRVRLAAIVFHDAEALKTINTIIHPRLMQRYQQWLKAYDDRAYTLHEAAVLFENGLDQYFDKIITVSAPEALRVQRIAKRDGLSKEAIYQRISMQWPDQRKNESSDFVIYSDNKQFMIPQVLKIHRTLTKLGKI